MPPVAQLVAEALDHDRPVGRQRAGRLLLLVQVGEEVVGRQLVEVVVGAQARHGGRSLARRASGRLRLELAREGAERPPELDRPADRVALPERQLARLAGRRADQHPIVADALDAPGASAPRRITSPGRAS